MKTQFSNKFCKSSVTEKHTVKARRTKIGLWTMLLTFLLVGASSSALAQDLPDAEEAAQAEGLPDRSDDDPLYWAEMRDIYTIQKRAFLKEGRYALSFYAGMIPNNIFEQYFPIGLRLNYHVLENIGVELSTSFAFRRSTDLGDIIRDDSGIAARDLLIGDTQRSHTTFGVTWSPIYGKFAYTDSGLFYFDIFFVGGAGVVVTQTESDFNAPLDTTAKPEGVVGGGMAVYMGQHAGIRLDFRQFIFQKVEGIGGAATPSEVSLGVSWFF